MKQNERNAVRLGLLFILILFSILVPVVSAYAETPYQDGYYVQQRDKIFLNHTYDLSGAIGFEVKFAWWDSNHQVGYSEPQKIVDVSSFTHKFRVDNTKFCLGDWYQWEGYIEKKPVLAFTIIPEDPVMIASVDPDETKEPVQTIAVWTTQQQGFGWGGNAYTPTPTPTPTPEPTDIISNVTGNVSSSGARKIDVSHLNRSVVIVDNESYVEEINITYNDPVVTITPKVPTIKGDSWIGDIGLLFIWGFFIIGFCVAGAVFVKYITGNKAADKKTEELAKNLYERFWEALRQKRIREALHLGYEFLTLKNEPDPAEQSGRWPE